MSTPNGCKEYIYLEGGYKVKGYDNCAFCRVGINFSDKHSIKKGKYVSITCSRCSHVTLLPIFKIKTSYGGECNGSELPLQDIL